MSLRVRPSRSGLEVSYKLKQTLKEYLLFANVPGLQGFHVHSRSPMAYFLAGALASLHQLSGDGINELPKMVEELENILAMLSENRVLIFEQDE